MKTGIQILIDNDKQSAIEMLELLNSCQNAEKHAKLLGYPYNKGYYEKDETNGVRRLMVGLKMLSLTGKHFTPKILLV